VAFEVAAREAVDTLAPVHILDFDCYDAVTRSHCAAPPSEAPAGPTQGRPKSAEDARAAAGPPEGRAD